MATGRAYQLLLGLFAVVAGAVVANVLLRTSPVSSLVDVGLQAAACLAVVVVGLWQACRATGAARAWRLLVAAAVACWLVAQSLWWWQVLVLHLRPAPPWHAAVAHFLFLALVLIAMVVLVLSGRPRDAPPRGRWSTYAVVVLVLDGLVATTSYAILVWSSHADSGGSLHLARSGGRPETLLYPLAGMVVVVVAVVLAFGYGADHRYPANYFLLSAGVTTILASDRLVAYFEGAGVDSGKPWARAGFVLGPLLIAYSVAGFKGAVGNSRSRRVMTWAQLLLPYVGAVGITVLIAFHTYLGLKVDLLQVILAVLVVFLLVVRQIVSIRENRLLLHRVLNGQNRLIHQLHHDSLTGLPNRLLFAERLSDALAGGQPFVLIYLDLDDFKDVNDQYGHAAGDRLLQSVGQRLRGCARGADTVARIGGDEFGILVQGDVGPPELFADRYRAVLQPPFALHGHSVGVRASMGLVTPDPHAPLSPDELLRRADSSMYEGKRLGKNSAVLYRHSAGAAMDFPTALRLADGVPPLGFAIVYQPIVRLPDGAAVAVEALSRWTAPNGTQVSPETFVAAAEAAGLGAEFDLLVLDTVCAEITAAGIDLVVHVNIGAARLSDRAFEDAVAEVLSRHGFAPNRLVLEITESVPIVDLAEGAAAIRRLQATGVRVALDDFGAGYNTLTYLHALPVDMIKLDRALTIGIEPGHDAVLYRSVLVICEQLGLEVIAEGVETSAQADTILSAGCTVAQGYRFGRPAPLPAVPSVRDQPITAVNAAR